MNDAYPKIQMIIIPLFGDGRYFDDTKGNNNNIYVNNNDDDDFLVVISSMACQPNAGQHD